MLPIPTKELCVGQKLLHLQHDVPINKLLVKVNRCAVDVFIPIQWERWGWLPTRKVKGLKKKKSNKNGQVWLSIKNDISNYNKAFM